MKKRLTYNNGLKKSVGLVVLLMMVLCPTTAWAKVGETFSDGVLMYKVTSEVDKEVAVYVYDGEEPTGAVVIPATINGYSVTSIENSALGNCSNMTSIVIPSSIKSIGGNAFSGCSGLTSVTIPDGVVSIGRGAFKGCSGLEDVAIGKDVTSIDRDAFKGCVNVEKVYCFADPTALTWNDYNCDDFKTSGLTECQVKAPSAWSAFVGVVNVTFVQYQFTLYDLYVAGTQVTDLNASDILGDGAASYNASTKTLTISGDITNSSGAGIYSEIANLTILVAKPSTVTGTEIGIGIYEYSKTTITGTPLLTVNGIYSNGNLTIQNANLNITDNLEGNDFNYLVIKSSTVDVSTTSFGAICYWNDLTLDGCYIETPEEGKYVASGSHVKDKEGNNVKTVSIRLGTAPVYYGIYVAGTHVTDKNASNILGNGAVSYNPSTKTLTLKDNITTSVNVEELENLDDVRGIGIKVDEEDATIQVAAPCTITSIGNGMYFTNDATITGSSLLTINSSYSSAISTYEHALTINTANLLLNGQDGGLTGVGELGAGAGNLTIQSSTITASATDYSKPAISGWNDLIFTGCYIEIPKEGVYDEFDGVVDKNGDPAANVSIKPGTAPVYYDIYVAGTQATDLNASDILGDGAVSYNPSTKTLTLKDNITATGVAEWEATGIKVDEKDVTILVAAPCTITSALFGIYCTKDATITGSPLLTINSTDGDAIHIDYNSSLTINAANLILTGRNGGLKAPGSQLGNVGNLTIHASTITASVTQDSYCAISGWNDLILTDCYITTPEGGVYDTTDERVENKNGDAAKTVSIYAPVYYDIYVAGTRVSEFNASDILGDGAVSYDASTKTLTLNGNITATGETELEGTGIKVDEENVTIKVAAPSTISSTDDGIYFTKDATITGSPLLTISSGFYAIRMYKYSLTINAANLLVKGYLAGHKDDPMETAGNLTIQSSTVTVSADSYALHGWKDLILIGCYIAIPEEGVYNEFDGVVDKNGDPAANVSIALILKDNDLAFSETSATATIGQSFTEPTLTNPHSLAVTYSSSKPGVAKVDEKTGKVTLVSVGTATITASFAGNVIFKAGDVSYTLTVYAKGDVNHDGKIDQTDVDLTVQHILGKKPDGFFEAAAHMNDDGVINAADLVLVVAEANKP